MDKPARGKKCDAIEGILDEGKKVMEEYKGEVALDTGPLGRSSVGRALRDFAIRDAQDLGRQAWDERSSDAP
jgi:hypothetical protein